MQTRARGRGHGLWLALIAVTPVTVLAMSCGGDAATSDADVDASNASGGAGGSSGRSGSSGASSGGSGTSSSGSSSGGSDTSSSSGGSDTSSSSGSSGTSSGGSGSSSGSSGTGETTAWAQWPMPNPAAANLPNPASYTTTDDVVTDNVTGLRWQRTVSPQYYTWEQAINYCETLVLAGESDWRLPTRIELYSLVDFFNTPIDPVAFPSTPRESFWTSSRFAGSPSSAWAVNFFHMSPFNSDVSNTDLVRCVR